MKAEQIDSHHHLWTYSEADYGWISPEMGAIRRDFTAADLRDELLSAGIDGAIAVQARQSLDETNALLKAAAEHQFIRGVVGWIPLIAPDLQDTLAVLRDEPKLKGVRHVLHDELDDNYMLREDFDAGIGFLKGTVPVYELLIFARHLPQTITLVDRHPDQVFVVDHIAKPRIRDGEFSAWSVALRELARRENVSCKLSGVVTEADWKNWRSQGVGRYMDEALETFGPARILFGSDWPVLTLAAGYREWVDVVRSQIQTLTDDEQALIMGANAQRIYQLSD